MLACCGLICLLLKRSMGKATVCNFRKVSVCECEQRKCHCDFDDHTERTKKGGPADSPIHCAAQGLAPLVSALLIVLEEKKMKKRKIKGVTCYPADLERNRDCVYCAMADVYSAAVLGGRLDIDKLICSYPQTNAYSSGVTIGLLLLKQLCSSTLRFA